MPGLLAPPSENSPTVRRLDNLVSLLRNEYQEVQGRVLTVQEALRQREVWFRDLNEFEDIETVGGFLTSISEWLSQIEDVIYSLPVTEDDYLFYDDSVTSGN